MQVIEVTNKHTTNSFHELPYELYKDDPNWVPALRLMVENVFNPQKNNSLQSGKVKRWLVFNGGECVGRIGAFFTESYSNEFEQATGGLCFFECIDDQNVADLLFDTAKSWLATLRVEAMDGPINIGENFFNWGLLADGFMQQSFGMNYHPVYYKKLWEAYGFKTYYEQYSYHLDITKPDLPERFWKIAAWMAKKPNYRFEKFSFKKSEKYIADFLTIHSEAWKSHDNYKPIAPQDLRNLIRESKVILDEDFIWFVYHDNKPIAFFMMMPDLNQILKNFWNGKMNLFRFIKLQYLKKRKVINRCRVLVMGVIPKFQKSGIESGIFWQVRQVLLKKDWYNEMELSWVGDFNPKMISIFKATGATHAKTHLTLRYLFDREKEFKRSRIIED